MALVGSFITNSVPGVNENNGLIPGCAIQRDGKMRLNDVSGFKAELHRHFSNQNGEIYHHALYKNSTDDERDLSFLPKADKDFVMNNPVMLML